MSPPRLGPYGDHDRSTGGGAATLCPKVCPRTPDLWLTPANDSQERNENPPVSCELTEGLDRAARFVRAVLFQLSYPPVSLFSHTYYGGGCVETYDCGFLSGVGSQFGSAASRRTASGRTATSRPSGSLKTETSPDAATPSHTHSAEPDTSISSPVASNPRSVSTSTLAVEVPVTT
jgi:hypothetical protein